MAAVWRIGSPAALIALYAAWACAPNAAGAAPPACPARGVHVIVRNSRAVVYDRRAGAPAKYACMRSTGRRYLLNPPLDGQYDELASFRLSGALLSFYGTYTEGASYNRYVEIADLRNGRYFVPQPVPSRFLVAGDGSVAWVSEATVDNLRGYQIFTAGAGGTNLLDGSFDIDPLSLALLGHTVTWTDAGQARQAHVLGPIAPGAARPLARGRRPEPPRRPRRRNLGG